MKYFANYEADVVVKIDEYGNRYIKRLEHLQEQEVSESCTEAYGIPSFGIFNKLLPITKEEYDNFGMTWDWDPMGGEKRFLSNMPKDWTKVEGTVCAGCIYSRGIKSEGDGCGRLSTNSFRNNSRKGYCEFRKTKLNEPSIFEQKAIEKWKIVLRLENPFREPRQLIKDFISEHLNGNIEALTNYDFRQLEGVERYGETHGYAFDIYSTDIVRAIATIIFDDIALKEVMFSRKRGTLVLAPSPVITEDLWGNQIDDHFVMFSILKFCPNRKGLSQRIIPCAKLCNTIGNLYLQPYSLVDYRHSHSYGRFLSDHMLSDLYNTLVVDKGGSRRMKNAVMDAQKFFAPYHGTNGWKSLMDKWLMDGLVDYYLHPEPFFEDFTLNADIPTDVYFKALDQCLEMCYEIIPNRAQRMVQRLKDKLGSW